MSEALAADINLDELHEDVDPQKWERDQLELAIQLSLAESMNASRAATPPPLPSTSHAPSPPVPNKEIISSSNFLTERASLEKARLARQKRHLEESAVSSRHGSISLQNERQIPPPKRIKLMPKTISVASSSRNFTTDSKGDRFWDGEMRRTPVYNVSSNTPTFALDSIIGDTQDLQWSIITAMDVQFDWVQQYFPPSLPTVVATSPPRAGGFNSPGIDAQIIPFSDRWIVCMPEMPGGVGVMHTKVMVLFYKSGRMRVTVNTSNLLHIDYGMIENMAWVQDFPLLSPDKSADDMTTLGTKFQTTLAAMLTRLNTPAGIEHLLNRKRLPFLKTFTSIADLFKLYDFSRVQVGLVGSMPGKYEGWEGIQTVGHTALMRVLRDIGARCPPEKQLVMECQGSSIGKYSAQWMRSFQISAEGGGAQKEWFSSAKLRRAAEYPSANHVKILFPTQKTVDYVGRDLGTSLFFTPSYWKLETFPRHLFYDSRSKTGKILQHTKQIIGIFQDVSSLVGTSTDRGQAAKDKPLSGIDKNVGGWHYMGSHNFTPSAWGTVSGTGTKPAIRYMRNFELGVVMPLPVENTHAAATSLAAFERPVKKYAPSDIPWFQSAQNEAKEHD